MLTIAPAKFAQSLAAARAADDQAARALAVAIKNTRVNTELEALGLERDPAGWANVLRKVADLIETLPELRAQADAARKALAELEPHACHRCSGTGTYGGPSNATRRGHAYCFYCNGTGDGRQPARSRAAEKARDRA